MRTVGRPTMGVREHTRLEVAVAGPARSPCLRRRPATSLRLAAASTATAGAPALRKRGRAFRFHAIHTETLVDECKVEVALRLR